MKWVCEVALSCIELTYFHSGKSQYLYEWGLLYFLTDFLRDIFDHVLVYILAFLKVQYPIMTWSIAGLPNLYPPLETIQIQ